MTPRQRPPDPEPPHFLSQAAYQALFDRIHGMAAARGGATVRLNSEWRGSVRWGRNRIVTVEDWRDFSVAVQNSDWLSVSTNQIDEDYLRRLIAWGEHVAERVGTLPGAAPPSNRRREARVWPTTTIWSEPTSAQSATTRLEIAERLIAGAEAAGMFSAGYLGVNAVGDVRELTDGRVEYVPLTHVRCSITVRTPDGSGSGWAGQTSYDWGRIDAEALAATALDKCLKSRNPVRIEPGRYTLVMEPQATFDLMQVLFVEYPMNSPFSKPNPWYLPGARREPGSAFYAEPTRRVTVSASGASKPILATKIGQRVFDPRINLSWDPLDPDLGVIPYWYPISGAGSDVYPKERVQWVTNGVLTTLGYEPGMTVSAMQEEIGDFGQTNGVLYRACGFRMDGGTTTVDEMVATTQRGLFVTRFSNVQITRKEGELCTGVTRDGLWLIENGRIAHAVKNLRWTESPFFAFNNVDQIGAAVPIFAPDAPPAMAPPMKVHDFNFTALEDAV